MKVIFATVLAVAFCLTCAAQINSHKVRLVKWSTDACDNTFDPYRLKTRISSIEQTDTTTIFTVHFSDNCCAPFKPAINFYKSKLVLLPYRQYKGDYCGCNCCFSIRYEVAGLTGRQYRLYFKESEVALSENYYDTVKPTFQVYNGRNINRTNKYGFKEGSWIKFYDNGKEEVINQYLDQSMFYDLLPLWSKGYYPSGQLSFYDRKDTTESWFEDGELKSQFINYKVADSTFEKGFSKYDNRVICKEYFEKNYVISVTDADYTEHGWFSNTLYRKEYYKDGKPKFLFGKDTIYSWFESGQLESKMYKGGRIQFDTVGRIIEQEFLWFEKGPKDWPNLENSLFVRFYSNGNIRELELVRHEPTHEGIAPGVRYSWQWNTEMNLVGSPEKWKESFPWAKFREIQLTPKMTKGLDKTIISKTHRR